MYKVVIRKGFLFERYYFDDKERAFSFASHSQAKGFKVTMKFLPIKKEF